MIEFCDIGRLRLLRVAIANSPIVVPAARPPARDFADWCERQTDIDTVILTWLRSHVLLQAPASLS